MRLIRPSQLSLLYYKLNGQKQGYCLNKKKSIQIRSYASSEVGLRKISYNNYYNYFYLVVECTFH